MLIIQPKISFLFNVKILLAILYGVQSNTRERKHKRCSVLIHTYNYQLSTLNRFKRIVYSSWAFRPYCYWLLRNQLHSYWVKDPIYPVNAVLQNQDGHISMVFFSLVQYSCSRAGLCFNEPPLPEYQNSALSTEYHRYTTREKKYIEMWPS